MAEVPLIAVGDVLGAAFEAGDPAAATRAGERSNLQYLNELVRAIATKDFGALAARFTPDVTFELHAPPGIPWRRSARGPEAVASAIEANFRSVCDQRPEPLSLVAQGDTILLMSRESGRWTGTGEPYEMVFAQQYTFRGKRLAAFRSIVSPTSTATQPG